jgi:hypothetical protein
MSTNHNLTTFGSARMRRTRLYLASRSLACSLYIIIIITLPWSCTHGTGAQNSRATPLFEDNMYAQLLMDTVSGSLPPGNVCSNTINAHRDLEQDQPGDRQRTQRRMIGWKQLENIYEALRVTWEEEIRGDFVEVGDLSGEASIFAAGVIKQLKFGRDVWVLGRSGVLYLSV